MCRSCHESRRFDGDNNPADIESGFLSFYANPWIQHFRSPSIMKKRHVRSSDRVDNIEFIRPSVQLANVRHDGEATSSKWTCREDSVARSAGSLIFFFSYATPFSPRFSFTICYKSISFCVLVSSKAEFLNLFSTNHYMVCWCWCDKTIIIIHLMKCKLQRFSE